MRRKSNKKIYIILALLLFIGIGYAYLTSNLNIAGSTKIASNTWNIHFANISVTNGSVAIDTSIYPNAQAATIDQTDPTKLSYNLLFTKPGDFYEFTVDIVNSGTINAKINSISSTLSIDNSNEIDLFSSSLPEWLSYSAKYNDNTEIQIGDLLNAGKTKKIKIRVEYKKDINYEQYASADGKSLELELDIEYIQNKDEIVKALRVTKGNKRNLQAGDILETTKDGKAKQEFYVLNKIGNSVRLLAKYNLLIGYEVEVPISGNTINTLIDQNTLGYGLQSSEATGYIPGTKPYSFKGGLAFGPGGAGNGCEYACYAENGTNDEMWEYDNSSYGYVHVYNYSQTLQNEYGFESNVSATIPSLSDAEQYANVLNEDNKSIIFDGRQSYWLGNAYDYSFVYVVCSDETAAKGYPYSYNDMGYRPIITVSIDDVC